MTNHKKTKAQLISELESLRFCQFGTDCAVDPTFFVRQDASFSYVNAASCRVLEYSREELLSLSIPDINPDFPRATWAAHWTTMKEEAILQV